jgi:hypothetical protein
MPTALDDQTLSVTMTDGQRWNLQRFTLNVLLRLGVRGQHPSYPGSGTHPPVRMPRLARTSGRSNQARREGPRSIITDVSPEKAVRRIRLVQALDAAAASAHATSGATGSTQSHAMG